jgi:predicted N-acyltransferase
LILLSRADGQEDVLEIIDFENRKTSKSLRRKVHTHQVVSLSTTAAQEVTENITKVFHLLFMLKG